jgi:hypothetical protein
MYEFIFSVSSPFDIDPTGYWLFLRSGVVQSIPSTAAISGLFVPPTEF